MSLRPAGPGWWSCPPATTRRPCSATRPSASAAWPAWRRWSWPRPPRRSQRPSCWPPGTSSTCPWRGCSTWTRSGPAWSGSWPTWGPSGPGPRPSWPTRRSWRRPRPRWWPRPASAWPRSTRPWPRSGPSRPSCRGPDGDRPRPGGGRMDRVPERPSLDGLEAKWGARWEADGTYRFDPSRPREDVYAIDFPPLTVSGSLHVGHVFSFSHTDVLARFQRMRGRSVYYPVGWDDNGLPTERRVENFYGVRCDPSLPYDPGFSPPATPPKRKLPISRPNFVELCRRLTDADEQVFETLWRQLGLSVDWSLAYTTIGERARRAGQRGFLRLLAGGEAYQAEAPTLWDMTYRTAVAQAEVEDREVPGVAVRLRFGTEGPGPGGPGLVVETTRPELLAACVALVAHPDDGRYRDLVGTTATTPLFGVPVPVVAHRLADPGKGTGLAMICTFGDLTDVLWWRELKLPVRSVVTRDGRLAAEPPQGVPAGPAWAELAGRTTAEARRRVVGLLRAAGDLVGEPRPVTHPVKFYENGDRPLEIVTSRQWFIRLLAHRERLL